MAYNLRRDHPSAADLRPHVAERAPGERAGIQAEYDTQQTVDALVAAVAACGYEALRVEADLECLQRLRAVRPDLVFNIAEGLQAESREAQVPVVCEMLGIPYTGSGVLPLALSQDKSVCARLLRAHGVDVPDFVVVPPGADAADIGLPFPLFVKPVHEGSSMGVTPHSLVRNAEQLARQVRAVHEAYGEAAMVEEYLPGREFTVGLLGNGEPAVLPVTEIDYRAVPAGYPHVYTYQFKKEWDAPRFYRCPAQAAPDLVAGLQAVAVAAYRCLGCADVARIDLRLDAAGAPHCIDVNPLPGLAPGFSDLPRQADAAGIGYVGLVGAILEAAVARLGV